MNGLSKFLVCSAALICSFDSQLLRTATADQLYPTWYGVSYAGVKVQPDDGVPNDSANGIDGSLPFYPEIPLVYVDASQQQTWTDPLSFEVQAQKSAEDSTAVSYWHDIPTIPENPKSDEEGAFVVNFVPEMPTGGIAKLEIMKDIPGNPIKFDTKEVFNAAGDRDLYTRPRYVAYGGTPFTYGAIPQTWENSLEPDPTTDIVGDNDPIDALDIGSVVPLIGAPYQAKVLGALGLIDDEETDWKVVLINVNDPAASQYSSIEDVPEALLEMIYTYFRDKPVAVGEAPGVFWPNLSDEWLPEMWIGLDQTRGIISHTQQQYADLISDCDKVKDLEFAYAGCDNQEDSANLNAKFNPNAAQCCKALNARCLSCAEGVGIVEFCTNNPDTLGCEAVGLSPAAPAPTPDPATPCCMALTADCLSCSAGVGVEEYCENNPETEGCEALSPAAPAPTPDPATPCCLALTADCLSCSAGVGVEEYCENNPETVGCS